MTGTREILEELTAGKLTIEEAEKKLRDSSLISISELGMIDNNRQERTGVPEVIFAESKTVDQIIDIVNAIVEKNSALLLTRVSQEKLAVLKRECESLEIEVTGSGDHLTVFVHNNDWTDPPHEGKIAILTAGTSDIVYARETEAIARIMGVETLSFFDVGVAGIHRLIEPVKKMSEEGVDAVVVFAGMEGALPTVVASLTDAPVIGVPVPVGYGYGGKGETALAAMLQSCAPGLAVVNIGNGLGAGSVAALIAKRSAKKK